MLSVFKLCAAGGRPACARGGGGGSAGQIYVDSQGDQEKKKPSLEIKEARDCDTAAAAARPLPLKAVKCFR